jgi:hypothetical protein
MTLGGLLVLMGSLLTAFSIGAGFGKWHTDRRWIRNARDTERLSCQGRLYKVSDVSPWRRSP